MELLERMTWLPVTKLQKLLLEHSGKTSEVTKINLVEIHMTEKPNN